MVSTKKVSVLWQIIFAAFIPFVGIWAVYRIQKLRKALLYIIIPEVSFIVIFVVYLHSIADDFLSGINLYNEGLEGEWMFFNIITTGFTVLIICLVHKWSTEWNKQFNESK